MDDVTIFHQPPMNVKQTTVTRLLLFLTRYESTLATPQKRTVTCIPKS